MRGPLFAVLVAGALTLSPQVHPARRGSASREGSPSPDDLGDIADLGYDVAAGLHFGGTHVPIGARVEGSLSGFSLKDADDDVRILNVTAQRRCQHRTAKTSPYLIGGLGIYNSKVGASIRRAPSASTSAEGYDFRSVICPPFSRRAIT